MCISCVEKVRPENWNPAWKSTQVDDGVFQYWLGRENTYGSQFYQKYGEVDTLSLQERKIDLAIQSR